MVSYFPPDRVGGVGEVAAHLHAGLVAQGHDSKVLTTGHTRSDQRVTRVGRSPATFGLSSLRRWKLAADFDVIHAHHGEALPFLAIARLRRSRPRILVTMHVDNRKLGDSYRPVVVDGERIGGGWGAWVQRRVKSRLKALLDSVAMSLADEVTFISRSTAVDVLGGRGRDAIVIYNGLPERNATSDQADVEPVELLYVGTAGIRKRTDLLPAVLTAVRRRHRTARLRIVGFDLEDQPHLAGKLAEAGFRDRVICEGAMTSDRVEPFYRAASVLVVPSAYEGLPMVIMEAFRAGLPVVATDVGGASEIIEEGVNGFLVHLDDPDAMGKRCAEIVADPDSVGMGLAARRTADGFTTARQLDAYVFVYRELVPLR